MRDGGKNGTDRIPLSFVGFATWFERIKACPAYEHPVGLTTARFDIGAEAVTAVRVEGLRRGFQGEGGGEGKDATGRFNYTEPLLRPVVYN